MRHLGLVLGQPGSSCLPALEGGVGALAASLRPALWLSGPTLACGAQELGWWKQRPDFWMNLSPG